jgi:hypothetical protein
MRYIYALFFIIVLNNSLFAKQNEFNPDISLILNGKYDYSKNSDDTYSSKFSLDESELTLRSNIDNMFSGSLTLGISDEHGAEVEEGYILTKMYGINAKFGRALWDIGSLNTQHPHADMFSSRPIAYQFFIGGDHSYNKDGMQFSYIAPLSKYLEIGAGAFGVDYNEDQNQMDYSFYVRYGDDITQDQDFRVGAYVLIKDYESKVIESKAIESEEGHNHEQEHNHEAEPIISNTMLMDLKYNIAFAEDKKISLVAEVYYNDIDHGVDPNETNYGYYVNAMYKFNKAWGTGVSYSEITSLNGHFHDGVEHKWNINETMGMIQYANSEFSMIRLQYGFTNQIDSDFKSHGVMLNYIVSLGAHPAHAY